MKVFWSRCGHGTGNFGDKLTPLLLDYLGISYEWAKPEEAEIFGIGSLIEKIPDDFGGLVWTTGKMFASGTKDLSKATVLAVRGQLTLDRIQTSNPAAVSLGDGGLLCHLFHRRTRKKYKLGIIPHFVDVGDPIVDIVAASSSEITIIDICADTLEVIAGVGRCEHILSSSLHGLILADSLGIPAEWVELNRGKETVWGNGFKFRDYHSAFGIADKQPVRLTPSDSLETILPRIGGVSRPGLQTLQRELLKTLERLAEHAGHRLWPTATRPLEQREASLLAGLSAEYFLPAPSATDASSEFATRASHNNILPLTECRAQILQSEERLLKFFAHALRLLAKLQKHGIAHRNIRLENILVRDLKPVLTNFEWATVEAPNHSDREPTVMTLPPGMAGDVYALSKVFAQLKAESHPTLAPLLDLMTADDPRFRIADVSTLQVLCAALMSAKEPSEVAALFPEAGEPGLCHRALRQVLAQVLMRSHALRQSENATWQRGLRCASEMLVLLIPVGSKFILVDDAQWERSEMPASRQAIPFLERHGGYYGPPPDDATAMSELERIRQTGADFFVVAWMAFWWRENYGAFFEHMSSHFRLLLDNEWLLVFDLRDNSSPELAGRLESRLQMPGIGVRLQLRWRKRGGWLGSHLVERIPRAPSKTQIEAVAKKTSNLGAQKLADEYGEIGGVRMPDDVRSSSDCGDLYSWLVQKRRPATVVEFGSAFGVSGMYFASGLAAAKTGHLYSFEINHQWADIAERNIRSISDRLTLTRGAFEDHVEAVVPGQIDLAFVDGIHTYDFVLRQFELLRRRMSNGGLIAFDDIDFKRPGAGMRKAWEEIAASPHVAGAVEVNGRVGLVELV